MAYESSNESSIAWQKHSMVSNIDCFCCGHTMPRGVAGLRHHCRACGNVICGDCTDSAILNERVREDGHSEVLKKSDHILLSTVCKTCKIRALISDNATSKGLKSHPLKGLGATLITSKHSKHHKHKKNNSSSNSSNSSSNDSSSNNSSSNNSSSNNSNNSNNSSSSNNNNSKHKNNDDGNTTEVQQYPQHQIKCFGCSIGVPKDLVATFDWTDILKPTKRKGARRAEQVPDEALFCHRCAFSKNDQRGGLRSASVLVTRLSPNVIAEDLHATLEDHFGGVQRVHIPRGIDGKPKTDADGFAFAQVFFYKSLIPQRTSSDTNLEDNEENGKITRWQNSGGLASCINTGWCWNGISKGQRCRVHHAMEENNSNPGLMPSFFPTGPIAVRSNMALSNKVRHVKGQHGLFDDEATNARERLCNKTVVRQVNELREQQSQIFTFNETIQSSAAGPFELAKNACQHNDVPSMKRLLKLNQRAISNDVKLRKQLLDPYALGPSGRSCIHVACVYKSFGILSLLLSDQMQAMQMAIRSQQQRVLGGGGGAEDGNMFLKVVNQVDISGHTPLHLVCENQIIDIRSLKLLLDRGSDPNLKTSRGETPLFFAARNGNIAVCLELAPVCNVSEVIAVLKFNEGELLGDIVRILKRRIHF